MDSLKLGGEQVFNNYFKGTVENKYCKMLLCLRSWHTD